jgi:signal transduction histidine kinase
MGQVTPTIGEHNPFRRKSKAGGLAWTCAAVSISVAIVSLGIAVRGALISGEYRSILTHQTLTPFITAGFAVIGTLVASRHPRNPIGWIFVSVGLLYALVALSAAVILVAPTTSLVYKWAYWFGSWLWLPAIFLPMTFVLLIFPNGHLPSHRWRFVAWAAALGLAMTVLVLMLHPGPLSSWGLEANPFGIPGAAPIFDRLLDFGTVFFSIGVLGSLAAFAVRFRRSAGTEREQMKWLAYAVGVYVLVAALSSVVWFFLPDFPWNEEISIIVSNLGILGIAVASAIAILRYHLFDIEVLINRTLIYGALTASVIGGYVLLVGVLSTLLHTDVNLAAAIVTAALTALVFRPLRARLQGLVDRAMFGAQDMPGPHHEIDGSQVQTNSEMWLRQRWWKYAHLAWLLCAALALVIFLVAIPLGYARLIGGASIRPPVDAPAWYIAAASSVNGIVSVLAALVSLGLGALLFWKRRDEPVALVVSFYLLAYAIVMAGPLEALDGFPSFHGPAESQANLILPASLIWSIQGALIIPTLPLFLYLFPNGRFVPHWARWLALLLIPVATPMIFIDWSGGFPTMSPLMMSLVVAYLGMMGAGVYAQLYRYRRVATPTERQQTKWVVVGMLLLLLLLVVSYYLYGLLDTMPPGTARPWWYPLGELCWWLSLTILPLSLALAVMRHRLWDVDVIINRALVYVLLSASVVALYVLLVAGLGTLFAAGGNVLISLVATALIALLFQPWRQRVQRGVNRLMYGERDDPYGVLSRLGQRLQATLVAESVLPVIVETVAQALKLPYAGIALKEGEEFQVAAEYPSHRSPSPTPPAARDWAEVFPLTYQSEVIGRLILAPRAPGETFSAADRHLVEQFARQAGVAAYGVSLTRELQRSRERLVVAREEERRRIRRDLHDGLGPALASLAMQADSAREWTHTDPDKTEAALAEITANAQTALQDIRRLVYDLRPPALDELGLVGALRQSAANAPSGLRVEIDAPQSLPPLPAAVEVAAYRIAQETLNNIVRHSRARHCALHISVQDGLRLELSDDGVGLPPDVRAGVGLISMRERAAELGGSCVIESAQGKGTRVLAQLPLAH